MDTPTLLACLPAGLAVIDRGFQAFRARLAGGVSPIGFSLACLDWLAHLAGLPGRQAELAARAWGDAVGLAAYAASAAPAGPMGSRGHSFLGLP